MGTSCRLLKGQAAARHGIDHVLQGGVVQVARGRLILSQRLPRIKIGGVPDSSVGGSEAVNGRDYLRVPVIRLFEEGDTGKEFCAWIRSKRAGTRRLPGKI